MKMNGCSEACGKKVTIGDQIKFIFTYRYNCECGAKYKLNQAPVILLTKSTLFWLGYSNMCCTSIG